MDRDLAILRCVEAIRMYAANHKGKLPESFNDITKVPVPLNPITNKPFEYILENDKAIIQSLLPIEKKGIISPHQWKNMNVRYELTIRKEYQRSREQVEDVSKDEVFYPIDVNNRA